MDVDANVSGVEQENPPIHGRIDALDHSIAKLEKTIEVLRNRLADVMTPSEPTAQSDQVGSVDPIESMVGQRLKGYRWRVDAAVEDLGAILNRLEV